MENTVTEIVTSDIFTEGGNTMQGFMELTGDFFTGLWSNPMGKIVITLGIVGGAIGLCRKLFLRSKRVGG